MDPALDAGEVARAIDVIEEDLRRAVPAARVTYLEPEATAPTPVSATS